MKDPLSHQTTITYTDSFSDNVNHNTYAYPTTVSDAEGNPSTMIYNYDKDVVTSQSDAKGAVVNTTYDFAGRVLQMTNQFNSAYTKYAYPEDHTAVNTFTTIESGLGEAFSTQILDGAGRVIVSASDFPGSTGLYRGVSIIYDVMGRVMKQSNATEINASWLPAGDDATIGWLYTKQEYDYKGRPTKTTNQDDTTRLLEYDSCGCAGGDTVTSTDEVLRKQKVYADNLGRTLKTEVFDGTTVYSTVKNTYNIRDQVTQIRQYQGSDTSGGAFQDTLMTYDGHGRLSTRKAPIETNPTIYTYYADDTVQMREDGRKEGSAHGARQTFTYNPRHLIETITHTKPGNAPESILALPKGTDVTFTYDAAGNRLSMNETTGNVASTSYVYNTISQLTSETRAIPGVGAGAFTLNYTYNLGGQLKTLTDPFNSTVSYAYNKVGLLSSVTGTGYGSVSDFAYQLRYRAWGGLKHLLYGNGKALDLSYNARLLLSQYNLDNFIVDDFTYNADGRQQRIIRANNLAFERTYTYDHAGRLTEAKTGRAARGQSEDKNVPDPYKQTYEYNEWSNLKRRINRFWNEDGDDHIASFVNDRNTAWDYDAAGNLKTDDRGATFTYNTASQMTRWETTLGGNTDNINQTYDGDGGVAWRNETRQNPAFSSTIHYVRSSVLGGRVIAELNGSGVVSGANNYRYVYFPNGAGIAREKTTTTPTITQMLWQHLEPQTGDQLESRSDGVYSMNKPVDPLGGIVGTSSPYIEFPNPRYGELLGNRQGFLEDGNPRDGGAGCYENGVPGKCEEVLKGLNHDSYEVEVGPGKNWVVEIAGGHLVYQPSNPISTAGPLPDPEIEDDSEVPSVINLGVSDVEALVFVPSTGGGQVLGNKPFPQLTGANLSAANNGLKLAKEATSRKECDEALKAAGIPSLAALINQLSINGNVFDGRSSTINVESSSKPGQTVTIAEHFKANKESVGAQVFGSRDTGRPGKTTFLNDYFFNVPNVRFFDHARALILIHEAVHQFGNKSDQDFKNSSNLTKLIAEKCFPALMHEKMLGSLTL